MDWSAVLIIVLIVPAAILALLAYREWRRGR
jgi:hypothetical protein